MPILRSVQSGFSMMELLIAIAISAIVLGLAVPSMQSFVGNSEIAATSNHLVYSLQTARSEAIKRAGFVGLCPSSNSLEADAACGGADYGDGWIVFADTNGDGERHSGEPLILQSEAPSNAFTFTADNVFSDRVYFGESGTSINPAGIPLSGSITIVFADSETRRVVIAGNGRINTHEPGNGGTP